MVALAGEDEGVGEELLEGAAEADSQEEQEAFRGVVQEVAAEEEASLLVEAGREVEEDFQEGVADLVAVEARVVSGPLYQGICWVLIIHAMANRTFESKGSSL